MNYEQLTEQFIDDHDWKLETVKWYRNRLSLFNRYADTTLETMSVGDFNRLLKTMRENGLSYSSRDGVYTAVQKFSNWAKANGHIKSHPFIDRDNKPKRPPKERKVIQTVSKANTAAILRTVEGDNILARRDRAILQMLATTGMRRSEIVGIEIADVNIQDAEILLKKTKFGHQRYIFLDSETVTALQRWLAYRPSCDHDHVFVSLTITNNSGSIYQPLQGDGVNRILDKAVKAAGIEARITPHMFRHTFATDLAKAGNPVALMQLMGHTNMQSTERYIHPSKDDLRDLANKRGV